MAGQRPIKGKPSLGAATAIEGARPHVELLTRSDATLPAMAAEALAPLPDPRQPAPDPANPAATAARAAGDREPPG